MGRWTNWLKTTVKTERLSSLSKDASVDTLFQELLDINVKKINVENAKKRLELHFAQLKHYEALDMETIKKLCELARNAKQMEEQKQHLRGRLVRNNRPLFLIAKHEKELPELMPEIRNYETKQKDAERTIMYLQEEQQALLEERQSLLTGYKFLKNSSIVFLVILVISLFGGFALLQLLRENIWIYLSGIAILFTIFLITFLLLKEKLEKELAINALLQKKAGKYLNKWKIKYFHYQRYLSYQYEKLGMDSAAKLEMYYNRYLKNKDNEVKYNRFNQKLVEIEEEMLDILKGKGIEIEMIDNFTEWLVAPKKSLSIQQGKKELQMLKQQLEGILLYEQELWSEIKVLQQDEKLNSIVKLKIAEHGAALDKLRKYA